MLQCKLTAHLDIKPCPVLFTCSIFAPPFWLHFFQILMTWQQILTQRPGLKVTCQILMLHSGVTENLCLVSLNFSISLKWKLKQNFFSIMKQMMKLATWSGEPAELCTALKPHWAFLSILDKASNSWYCCL